VAGFDGNGFLAEGATENMGIVSKQHELLFPKLECILCGTTMMRVVELAQDLVKSGKLSKVEFRNISRADILDAAEVLVVGTTPNVAMVREFDGRSIGGGKPGPVYIELSALLVDDIRHNKSLLTPVPGLT
jgi:branched-chain amino acid aminotransferase